MLRFVPRSEEETSFERPSEMSETLYRLLTRRGIASAEEAERFLHPRKEHLHDPFLLNDMHTAVERIERALADGERICVYGDYDADGITSSAILADYLRSRGAEVEVYLPSRHNEGYGLNDVAITGIAERNSLMITVDCGVTNQAQIDLAKQLGMDCIVTDHHRPAENLPDCPVINPLLNGYPFGYLCGAGVAFKLVSALGGPEAAMEYADLAALGTVADIVTLQDENRVIVTLGLQKINSAPRLGLKALINAAGLSGKTVDAGTIGFQLGPRLNSAGRLGDALRGHRLLLTKELREAEELAAELNEENRKRKDEEDRICSEAKAQLQAFDYPAHRAVIVAGEGWNPGVIGLAASRLMNETHYPTIVLSEKDGVLTGSCRSIDGVDIHKALTAVSHRLDHFGGHAKAAGLTVMRDQFEDFKREFEGYLRENTPQEVYIPTEEYDLEIHFDSVTPAFYRELQLMEPTGEGNPAPRFRALAYVLDSRAIGANGKHLSLQLSENNIRCRAVYWNAGALAKSLPECVDAVFSITLNEWNGRTSAELKLDGLAPADNLQEIRLKTAEEDTFLRIFLTEILYNKKIKSDSAAGSVIDPEGLKRLLARDLQGTLLLCCDMKRALALAEELGEYPLDLALAGMPGDVRAFNALSVYPVGPIPKGYRRAVLIGMPEDYPLPEGIEVFRMEGRPGWFDSLPDVDQMREVYKGARTLLQRPVRYDTFGALAELLSELTGVNPLGCAASLLTLHDMALINLDLETEPIRLKLCPLKKTDPESSAVWRRIQNWKR